MKGTDVTEDQMAKGLRPEGGGMTGAIYGRVSTPDQSVSLQVSELTAWATRMGWTIGDTYLDEGVSGKRDQRPGLDRLMEDARMRRFDAVLVWKLDRFGRSVSQLVNNIQMLDGYGVRFITITEGIDTDKNNPLGRLILHLFAALAEFEHALIMERVAAGRKAYAADFAAGRVGKTRHSRSGKDLAMGKPRKIYDRAEARKMRDAGLSYRVLAVKFGVNVSTLHKDLK